MGPVDCLETLVINYQSALCKIAEEQTSDLRFVTFTAVSVRVMVFVASPRSNHLEELATSLFRAISK
jgi:hypothetical protein